MSWTQQTITFLHLTDTRKRPVLVNVADISHIREYDGYSGIARISGGQEVYVKETCTEIIAAIEKHNERAISRADHTMRTPDHVGGERAR